MPADHAEPGVLHHLVGGRVGGDVHPGRPGAAVRRSGRASTRRRSSSPARSAATSCVVVGVSPRPAHAGRIMGPSRRRAQSVTRSEPHDGMRHPREREYAMPDVSFDSLAVVMGVAFVVPARCSGCVPRLRIPAVVLEIVLGIIVGPQVLGWAQVDEPVADPLAHRSRLPAVPRRTRARPRPAARPAAHGRGARASAQPGARASSAGVALDAVGFVHEPAARRGRPHRDVARVGPPGAQGGRAHVEHVSASSSSPARRSATSPRCSCSSLLFSRDSTGHRHEGRAARRLRGRRRACSCSRSSRHRQSMPVVEAPHAAAGHDRADPGARARCCS